jgi:hypothetical protein
MTQVYQIIFESASDTNINVQMSNSWALANLSFIKKFNISDPYVAQESLMISIQYACSTKEKVVSNGLRSLGYYL